MDENMSTKHFIVLAVIFGAIFAIATGFLFSFFSFPQKAATGLGSGQVDVTVGTELGIEVVPPYNVINFGTLNRGQTQNTLPPGTVLPFLIRNMGNVMADVEVCANQDLWSGAAKVPSDYQFSVANADPRVTMDNCMSFGCFDVGNSQMTPANMPIPCPAGMKAVNNLNWEDNKDEAITHIYLHVPVDEPAGTKSSTVTFTGVSSDTYQP